MRWTSGYKSSNVEDRRGAGGGLGAMALLPFLSRFGIGGVVLGVVLIVGQMFLCGDRGLLSGDTQKAASTNDEQKSFVSFVLDDAQKTWKDQFAREGMTYREAGLVLFTDRVATGCGLASSATGPFYCPRDTKVYIDLGFYGDLQNRFGAAGDFAQAYVIAHEVGHHVQRQLGALNERGSGADSGSVRTELQADCYAGVWANSTKQRDLLDEGDIEEALRAAAAIGDDRLQKQSGGDVQPESWTHGSSEQRVRWFKLGYDGGSLASCDTFRAAEL